MALVRRFVAIGSYGIILERLCLVDEMVGAVVSRWHVNLFGASAPETRLLVVLFIALLEFALISASTCVDVPLLSAHLEGCMTTRQIAA